MDASSKRRISSGEEMDTSSNRRTSLEQEMDTSSNRRTSLEQEMDTSSKRRSSSDAKRLPKNSSRETRAEGRRGRPKTRRQVKSPDNPNSSSGLRKYIKSPDNNNALDVSRKSRSTSTSKNSRARSASTSSRAEASVIKNRGTALTLFDKSTASEESFNKWDDDTRRLVKEAGFIEASEYISNPRSRSTSVNPRSRSTSVNPRSRSTSLSESQRSLSQSQRRGGETKESETRDLDDDDDGFKVLRSASLSRQKSPTDYDPGTQNARRATSLSRIKEASSYASRSKRSSKKETIYLPPNEARGVRRRWSLSDTISKDGESSTAAVLESDAMSTTSEEKTDGSVGRRQTVLDILASPSTSRPKLTQAAIKALPPPPDHGLRSRRNVSRERARSSSNENRRRRSRSRNQDKSQDQILPPLTSMTPAQLPNLLAPQYSDDESGNFGDSQQNLLENISISDIVNPVRGRSILEKIASDASLALTARWQSVPVIATPFPAASLDASDYYNEGELSCSSRANSPRPERDSRSRSKKERIEKIEKSLKEEERKEQKRRGERVLSPRRQPESRSDKKERKQMNGSNKSGGLGSSYRRQSTNMSQRRRQSSRSRSRSNSRSLSQSASLHPRNSLVSGPGESDYHRQSSSIFTPKSDTETGESDTNEQNEQAPEPVGKRQSLTIESLYGGGRGETDASKDADRLSGHDSKKKSIRSASLSPMRVSQRRMKVEDDLDAVQHGGKMLSSVSETGHRMRTMSTPSRRRLLESGAVDTEAVKRDGRSRLAKERKSRTNRSSGADLEGSDNFNRSLASSMELSHESMSSLKSNTANARGNKPSSALNPQQGNKPSSALNPQQSNKSTSAMNPQQLRRRRHSVAKDMLHQSITSIPELPPELEKMTPSDHNSNLIPNSSQGGQGGQVWQRRRRSVGKEETNDT
jgi:hypothetical protein